MWTILDEATDTRATEIPGLGCIVGVPGLGLTFVPGARLRPVGGDNRVTHVISRDDRSKPPIANGPNARDIGERAKPDPGAQHYFTTEDPEY